MGTDGRGISQVTEGEGFFIPCTGEAKLEAAGSRTETGTAAGTPWSGGAVIWAVFCVCVGVSTGTGGWGV